ncbi:MAG: threonine aldolase family protein [Oscillospiraceae bacterium]
MIKDFRSDTVTQPTDEMKQSVFSSQMGDDCYDDDKTTKDLERLAAEITGKEAALYVMSGVMGNQLAIMSSTNPGEEVICGEFCHIFDNEAGGAAFLSGVTLRTVENDEYTIYSNDIKRLIRPENNIQKSKTTLVCVENATSMGNVIDIKIMKETYETAKELGLNVHLDGARIFNAATYLGVSVKEIAENADTAMFCLSKGLAAPMGSMLVGRKKTIDEARRYRKMIGGGLRQTGFTAGCGIIAINKMSKRLQEDHDNAMYIAKEISLLKGVSCDLDKVHINIVFAQFNKQMFDFEKIEKTLLENKIKITPFEDQGDVRFVTNIGTNRETCENLIKIIKEGAI